jgi:glycerol-3-phosphate dehydrogenase
MRQSFESDVVIIGGGIAGASVAREMSRYKLETILADENESLCDGVSKGSTNPLYRGFGELNSIIVKTYMLNSGKTLYDLNWPRARQEKEGWETWHEEWLPELDIPHKELKTLYLATSKGQLEDLERVWRLGNQLGGVFAEMEKVDRAFIFEKDHKKRGHLIFLYLSNGLFPPFRYKPTDELE